MKLETLDFAHFEAFDAGEIRRMSGLLDAAFKSSGFLVARNLGFQTSLVDNLLPVVSLYLRSLLRRNGNISFLDPNLILDTRPQNQKLLHLMACRT